MTPEGDEMPRVGGYGPNGCTCSITPVFKCPVHGDEADLPRAPETAAPAWSEQEIKDLRWWLQSLSPDWYSQEQVSRLCVKSGNGIVCDISNHQSGQRGPNTAKFIAVSRNIMPKLLDELDRLRALLTQRGEALANSETHRVFWEEQAQKAQRVIAQCAAVLNLLVADCPSLAGMFLPEKVARLVDVARSAESRVQAAVEDREHHASMRKDAEEALAQKAQEIAALQTDIVLLARNAGNTMPAPEALAALRTLRRAIDADEDAEGIAPASAPQEEK